jgi:ATP-dependent DNA helicase RecQ
VLLYDPEDLRIQEYLLAKDRPTPRQFQQVFAAFSAWVRDDRPVDVKDLALSAQVQQNTARAALAALEEMGVAQRVTGGRFESLVTEEQFAVSAGDLIESYRVLRMEDERRLKTVSLYADADTCRSQFLRAYFGEADPPECGICDVCDPRPRTIKLAVTRSRTSKGKATPPPKKKKKRRKPRRRKKRKKTDAPGAASPRPDQGDPEKKKKKKRRRRRRKKKKRPSQDGPAGGDGSA